MKFFKTFDIAASGMKVEQKRMDVVSNNIANAHTTKTADGTPYRRQVVQVSSQDASAFESAYEQASLGNEFTNIFDETGVGYSGRGAKVDGVAEDGSDFNWIYDPSHPDAVKEGPKAGYVAKPNVNIIQEMTLMMQATRAYEANATTVEAAKSMAMKALQIGKG
ncbi:MAG TPA: flagellar basal body rod protein FlgC [Phycisphaerales bacterium]|nr:flagellar basal body rod protein FlgC [Phycisphaerales bacterium]